MPVQYSVTPITGIKLSDRRSIAFLWVDDGDDDSCAGRVFQDLDEKTERLLRSRFDFWVDGGIKDEWFHGWPNYPKFKQCFVFKWKENRQNNRFYGFLCHPKPKTNARFQLCVLVIHATKNQQQTDTAELERVERVRIDPAVQAATAAAFPDEKGKTRWPN